ncbi:serine hydrolase domain-containing protein [Desulfoplanes sp.]
MRKTHPVLFLFILVLFLCSCEGSGKYSETERKIINLADGQFEAAQGYSNNVPGLIVSVQDKSRSVDLTYTIGLADTGTEEKLTKKHSFKIASVTKSMVTNVIAQYVDDGILTFDTPLSTYFPDLRQAADVTVRMLGDMTSGYHDYLSGDYEEQFDNTPYFTAIPQELIDEGLSHGLLYSPGTGMSYSNTNTVILGQIIEQLSGQSLETVLRERLFTPLGMSHSGAPASGSYMPEPNAHSYHPDTLEDWTEKMDYSPEYACGNAYSTIRDLKIWVKALATGALLSPATYSECIANGNPFAEAPSYIYRFGILEYKGFLGHSGDTDYYLSEAFYHPEKDITIVVLSNTSLTGFTGEVFRQIVDLLEPEK